MFLRKAQQQRKNKLRPLFCGAACIAVLFACCFSIYAPTAQDVSDSGTVVSPTPVVTAAPSAAASAAVSAAPAASSTATVQEDSVAHADAGLTVDATPTASPAEVLAAPAEQEDPNAGISLMDDDGGVAPTIDGSFTLVIKDNGDGKLTDPSQFSVGAANSDSFIMSYTFSTSSSEKCRLTVPAGFNIAPHAPIGTTLSSETLSDGSIEYTLTPDTASFSVPVADIAVTVDFSTLVENATNTATTLSIKADLVSSDGLTITPEASLDFAIPPKADTFTVKQVDTGSFTILPVSGNPSKTSWTSTNLNWTPYDLAGANISSAHNTNQANSSWPSRMIKPYQVEVTKPANSLLPEDFSLSLPLPLSLQVKGSYGIPNTYNAQPYSTAAIDICVDNTWYTLTMKNVSIPSPAFSYAPDPTGVITQINSGDYGLCYAGKSSFKRFYYDTAIFTFTPDILANMTVDARDVTGTGDTLYELLCKASAIRFNLASDVMWDNAFDVDKNGNALLVSPLASTIISDNTETVTAGQNATLTAGGATFTSQKPLKVTLDNTSTDKSLVPGISLIDEMQMDATTTYSNANGSGYTAGFSAGRYNNANYAYHTNLELNYSFPYEFSPTGTITLIPISTASGYDQNPTGYDYTFTISKRNLGGSTTTRQESVSHLDFTESNHAVSTFTPALAEGEWISNIQVTATKAWKEYYDKTLDKSVVSTDNGRYLPVFRAQMTSRSQDEQGHPLQNGTLATVQYSIKSDQASEVKGSKQVTLIGDYDNILLWSEDVSANKYPIGEYGETSLKYIELHMRKYTDTTTYENPYIELTGDAAALLSKVTEATTTGTGTNAVTRHLTLCGYRLNTGDWVNVSAAQAAAMLKTDSADGDSYFDLGSKIPAGAYLTGLRLAPTELNNTTVDTTSAPMDENGKYYQEDIYYLNLYDKVLPGVLGYDDTLAKTYTNIVDLNSPLSYNLAFNCGFLNSTHTDTSHIPDGKNDAAHKKSATLVFGDLPEKIFTRDNNYYVQPTYANGDTYRDYSVTELCNVAIDDGPALRSTTLDWSQMTNLTLSFGNTTPSEARMLALTKGVSLASGIWNSGVGMYRNEVFIETIRYKTNKSGGNWITVPAVASKPGHNRSVNYFTLADDEYVTDLEVNYPADFLYRSGYDANGVDSNERKLYNTLLDAELADVGLLTNGQIPQKSPVEGDNYSFHNDEQLPYSAQLTFTDAGGVQHTLAVPSDAKTAKLNPLPTMLVDNFTVKTVSYSSSNVYQGDKVTATLTHSYQFTALTAPMDPTKVIHPTLCYELAKGFTVVVDEDLANSLGVNSNQITLVPKNDGSGNSILKIQYGPQGPQTRNTEFQINLPIKALPTATASSQTPLVNSWLTLDYDTTLNESEEGEYISINPTSSLLEQNPGSVLPDSNWSTGTRLALKQPLSGTVSVLRNSSSALQFNGTDGNGGGGSTVVTGHDGNEDNIFGISETLYAPTDNTSTNWVAYIAVPSKGQVVPYSQGSLKAPASQFSLQPSGEVSVANISGMGNVNVQYYVPKSNGSLVPSMAGLAKLNDIENADKTADATEGTWKTWNALTDDEKNDVSYVRVFVDKMPAGGELTSNLLMKLSLADKKTQVDTLTAYTSLVYNYTKSDGNPAFPVGNTSSMNPNGGKGSNWVEYRLADFSISGYLWHEQTFDNLYTSADGTRTNEGVTLTLVNESGDPIYHSDGSTRVTVTFHPEDAQNQTWSVPVPCAGTYYLTMESTQKNWLPAPYVKNATGADVMRFDPAFVPPKGTAAETKATATVTLTNQDVLNINGGIEQWGTLTVNKALTGAYADRTKQFGFNVTIGSSSVSRTYPATKTAAGGSTTSINLSDGHNTTTLGEEESLSVKLPVGLQYTIAETQLGGYSAAITTTENGQANSPVVAWNVTNKVVALTYDEGSEQDNGGNVEDFTNRRNTVTPTGLVSITRPYMLMALLAGVCLAGVLARYLLMRRRRLARPTRQR